MPSDGQASLMKRKILIAVVGFLAIIIFWALVHVANIFPWFDGLIMKGMLPFSSVFYKIEQRTTQTFGRIRELRACIGDRETVIAENRSLKSEVAKLSDLASENTLLRKQLSFTEKQSYFYIVGRVMTKVREGDHTWLIVNQGEQSGVRVGLPVASPEGALVGKIIKVMPEYSFLQLITDDQSVIGGVLAEQPLTKGLIKGEHNLSVKMDTIPIGQEIKENDTVITSGIEEIDIPRGLVVGTIEKITGKPGDIFQNAYLNPAADLFNLRLVTIIKIAS